MIVFEAAKAVLLLNPKTGTRSIVDYFSQPRFRDHANVVNGGHVSYLMAITRSQSFLSNFIEGKSIALRTRC